MSPGGRFVSVVGGRGAIVGLGALYVVSAIALAYMEVTGGTPTSNVLVLASFVGGPGAILLYGGYRLPQTSIHPKFYPTITGWCLGAIAVLTGLLVIYDLQPTASIDNPIRAILVITGFVVIPAFAGGLNDARAKTRALELERALDLLEKTERIADVGGWEIDTDTMDVFWTDHLFDLLGVPYEHEPPLEEALDVYHEEDRQIIEEAIEEALDAGSPFDVEARFHPGNGEVRWLRVQGIPEVVNGEIVSLRGAAQDVTERNERERELQRTRDRMEIALNATDSIVWDWNVDDDRASFYPSEETLYGTSVENWEEFIDVIHPEDREKVREGIENALETGEPKYEEIRIIRNGEVRWIEAPGRPVQDDDGPTRMIGVARDVTDRKMNERKLTESNERLEQFAYAASHDLQEPLRMVSSYLQLIEHRYGEALDEDAEEFLAYAVDGADRMRSMIDGLLQYSRIETQGEPFEWVDLNEVVADVRKDLAVQIAESDAEVESEGLPRVRGDKNQLHQLFQNLLRNAIQYSGDEPPRVHLSAERNGTAWRLSVRDEGIGIDPAQQERIFEVFQRLHSRDEHPGSGIGLALCERIVERHGGRIWVESEPGQGSTFSITLPVARNHDR